MIDILNIKFKKEPQAIFIKYDGKNITYQIFYYMVLNLIEDIKNINDEYIGIQIENKLKLLVLVTAINRLKKIPVIFPNIPNIIDYINSSKVKITFKDKNIHLNQDKNNNNKNIEFESKATQAVLFTSGTTGPPKACEITYENFYESSLMWNKIIQFNKKDIYLNHMPLNHVSGLCVFYRALYLNFIMVLENFNAQDYYKTIIKYKITHTSMVPSMLNSIIHFRKNVLELINLSTIIIGGSKIDSSLSNKIKKYRLPAYMSYGMTESCSGIAGYWIQKSNKFKPHHNVNISVNNSTLLIKSITIMKKYLNSKEMDFKFQTSDLCKINNDGLFEILGRSDGVLISGGEKISVMYVKTHIESYVEINSCILKIIEDKKWGEVLHAYLECEKDITAKWVENKLRKNLPNYMIPKKINIL